MDKTIKKYGVISAFVVLFGMFVYSGGGDQIETKNGLPILYKLRDAMHPPTAPGNIFIITPYKERTGDLPAEDLSDWDRNIHADLLSKLLQLDVELIVFDLYLKRPGVNPEGDRALASLIANNNNVILNQKAYTIEEGKKKDTKTYYLNNPMQQFVDAASSLSPSLVENKKTRQDTYYLHYDIEYDLQKHGCFGYANIGDDSYLQLTNEKQVRHVTNVFLATAPFYALEQYLYKQQVFKEMLQELRPRVSRTSAKECEIRAEIRKMIADSPELLGRIKKDAEQSLPVQAWLELMGYFSYDYMDVRREQQLKLEPLGQDLSQSLPVKFFGPPQTIQTYDYTEFEQLFDSINSKQKANLFKDAFIFLGASFNAQEDFTKDNDFYYTVYSNKHLKPMSGVEFTATAFSNLYNKTYLTKYTRAQLLFATCIAAILVLLATVIKQNNVFVLLVVLLIICHLLIAEYQFTARHNWMAVFLPIMTMVLGTALVLFNRLILTTEDKIKLEENLQLYLSETVARQVETGNEFELELAVCLVTDVEGFTSVGEQLSATQLHRINRTYFELLINCVNQFDADIVKTYGDSLTAVWKVKESDTYTTAIQAGLAMLQRVETFNTEHPGTPYHTRLGMSCGEIVIGYVGDQNKRTIELTGEAIYVASRLEQLNKTKNTRFLATKELALSSGQVSFTDLGEELLRGKLQAVEVVKIA